MRVLGDLHLAEDAAQDAFATAADRWPRDGAPANPGAWLTRTARNHAIDRLRRERTLDRKLRDLPPPAPDHLTVIPDERLELLFLCCHPALGREAQVALTLRAVGGLANDEIAAAFLVTPETMKRRLSRARMRVRETGIPFAVPPDELLPARLAAVHATIYLIFNAGYGGRVDLATEAVRLGRLLAALLPADAETHGLLALMLLHDARGAARQRDGELVLLADQDRALWDAAQLAEGRAHLARAGDGPYGLQAAIAAEQAGAPIAWPRVVALYDALLAHAPSPVVALNRAVAVAEAGDPAAALGAVDALTGLDAYRYLHATRAELLRRLGRDAEARAADDRALALTPDGPERRLLLRRR